MQKRRIFDAGYLIFRFVKDFCTFVKNFESFYKILSLLSKTFPTFATVNNQKQARYFETFSANI